MKIKIKLFSYLIHQAGFSEKELEIGHPLPIKEILTMINVQPTLAQIILRNGHPAKPEDLVEDGDRLSISPIFSGG